MFLRDTRRCFNRHTCRRMIDHVSYDCERGCCHFGDSYCGHILGIWHVRGFCCEQHRWVRSNRSIRRQAIPLGTRRMTVARTVTASAATATAAAASATFAFFTECDWLGFKRSSWLLLLARFLCLWCLLLPGAYGCRRLGGFVCALVARFVRTTALITFSARSTFLTLRAGLSCIAIFAVATLAVAVAYIAASTLTTTSVPTFARRSR